MKGNVRIFLSRRKCNFKELNDTASIRVHIRPKDNPDVDVVFASAYMEELYLTGDTVRDINLELLKKQAGKLAMWNDIFTMKFIDTSDGTEELEEFIERYECPDCDQMDVLQLPDSLNPYGLTLSELPPLNTYDNSEIKTMVKKTDMVADEMIEEYEKYQLQFHIVTGFAPGYLNKDDAETAPTRGIKIYCTNCGKTVESHVTWGGCDCENTQCFYLIDKSFKKYVEKMMGKDDFRDIFYDLAEMKTSKNFSYRFIEMLPDGIKISMLNVKVSVNNGVFYKDIDIPYEIIYRINTGVKAFKTTKNGVVETDISETTVLDEKDGDLYCGCSGKNGIESFLANADEKILRAMGLLDVLKTSGKCWHFDTIFFSYIVSLAYFPPLEQLIKVGYHRIFKEMSFDMFRGWDLEKYEKLIDKNGTTSKNAIRLPKYIMESLVSMEEPLDNIINWVDIYELTGLSKEQFEDVINSRDFIIAKITLPMSTLVRILKYGYDLKKLLRYIVKTGSTEKDFDIFLAGKTLYDYLFMCEFLHVTPDKYPMDLKKQHDDIATIYNSAKLKEADQTITKIAESLEKCFTDEVISKRPKFLDEYVVVFPKTTTDFVEEGNMQHNCVASYAKRVTEERCYVYFLREKKAPDKSFITAEYVPGYGQFLLSNNRSVRTRELLAIRDYMSNVITDGIKTGKLKKLRECG